jgi:hypothetical protein
VVLAENPIKISPGYCWSSSRIVLDGLKSGKPQLCLLQK